MDVAHLVMLIDVMVILLIFQNASSMACKKQLLLIQTGVIKMIFNIKTIILLILTINLTSCFAWLNREYYEPLPDAYISWSKSKPSIPILRVKKDMLECGTTSITGADKGGSYNNGLLVSICMESLGYKHPAGLTASQLCQLSHNKNYPACKPGAIIPKPSVERRLNSEVCKSAKKAIVDNIKSNNANYKKCVKEISDPNVILVDADKKTFCNYHLTLSPLCKP